MATIMPPRKYKLKPPISALDDAAAQHRRAQSCKAQRAYRQRKEDAIATLSSQIKGLEDIIDKLSICFLGLNDKILQHLGDGMIQGESLAKGIRDSMEEFKGIIESGDGKDGNTQVARIPPSSEPKNPSHSKNDNNGVPTPPEPGALDQNSYTDISAPRPQLQNTSTPSQDGSTIFSGPTFYGLTLETLPLQPFTPVSSPEHLAHRIYTTTIAKAFSLLQTAADDDPIFRRVFDVYFSAFPQDAVRGEVARMMTSRDDWNPWFKAQGTQEGWWSALQVAGFISGRGFMVEGERLRKSEFVVSIEEFLDEILVDARCAWDTPEYRMDTVVRVVSGMIG